MFAFKSLERNFQLIFVRFFSQKFKKSLINYKQMPDVFYNEKKEKLPPKIYTALVEATETFFEYMLNILIKFQYRYDLSLPSLYNHFQARQFQKIKKAQRIPAESIKELGVELSVAHLVVHMGGAVRLKGSDSWIGHNKEYRSQLPRTRVRDLNIEAIDLSGCLVMYDGLEYLPSLLYLKELKLNTSPFLDDHCLRRISRMRTNLELLDISNCPQITGKGLATLWNLKNLKFLDVSSNPTLEDKELVCILLMEKIPQLQITGVDYFEALTGQQKEEILKLFSKEVQHKKISTEITDEKEEHSNEDIKTEKQKISD